jgi:hypothetical protein
MVHGHGHVLMFTKITDIGSDSVKMFKFDVLCVCVFSGGKDTGHRFAYCLYGIFNLLLKNWYKYNVNIRINFYTKAAHVISCYFISFMMIMLMLVNTNDCNKESYIAHTYIFPSVHNLCLLRKFCLLWLKGNFAPRATFAVSIRATFLMVAEISQCFLG